MWLEIGLQDRLDYTDQGFQVVVEKVEYGQKSDREDKPRHQLPNASHPEQSVYVEFRYWLHG